MATPSHTQRVLFGTLSVLSFVIAAVAFFAFRQSFVVTCIVLLAAAAGAQAARRARGLPAVASWSPEKQKALALKPWHWLVGLALIGLVVVSVGWLYSIAQNGYNGSVFSLYFFAVTFLICGLWWAMLFTRWLHRPRI
ncbi:MAG: hypothetical protein V4567_11235 [Pseudomonadota bacterium]